jgi:hypothetical protein
MLYFRFLKIVQHDIIFVLVVFLVSIFQHVLVGWFQYSYLNNIESPLGYVACFLNLFFDVLSVILRLQNLWSPFKIPFYLVPAIVFTFKAHAWGPYATCHGMARKCHIECSMITAVWTHLRMFLNSKFYYFMFKWWILLKPVLGAWRVTFTFQYRPWTGSIKPSLQHFQFCRVGLSLGSLYLSIFCFC